jgi:hypothetical protein
VNADTEPQVVPGQPRLTNERSRTCSVKVARVGVRQPFLHSTALAPASLGPFVLLRNGIVVKPATTTSLPVGPNAVLVGKRLNATQMSVSVRLVLLGPVLVIFGGLSVANQPVLGGLLICLGVLALLIAVYRLRVNEHLGKDDRTAR